MVSQTAEVINFQERNIAEEMRVVRTLFDPSNKLSDEQIKIFLEVAKEKKLDPKMRQICAIPKYNKNTGRCECIIVVQIDGLRLVAERTKKYAPGRTTEYAYDNNGKLLSATAYVKKLTEDGVWHDVGETAYLAEYNQDTFPWKKMAHVMISKCAEAKALRRAFPGDLSGLYADDEIEKDTDLVQSNVKSINEQIISEDTANVMIDYINKFDNSDEITKSLTSLCKVKDIKEIKQNQLQACRNYIEARRKNKNENKS